MKSLTNEMKKYAVRIALGTAVFGSLTFPAVALPVQAGAAASVQCAETTTYTKCGSLEESPVYHPGETYTNSRDHAVKLIFSDASGSRSAAVTVPAHMDYRIQYEESASGVTAATSDYWICYKAEDDALFFMPNP